MGVLKDGESFLLLGHLLEQSSVRLLRPKHLSLEHELKIAKAAIGRSMEALAESFEE